MEDKKEIDNIISGMKRFLSVRERCRSEVEQYLFRKGYSRNVIAEMTEALKEKDILDELRFTRNRIESRIHKGYGPHYIKNELSALKIDRRIITETMEEFSEEDFLEGALALFEKKLSQFIKEENTEERLYRALKSRGFSDSHYRFAMETAKEKFPHWSKNR
ncbi:MAG: recombination regulator RecX [Spirochaetia bacterium]|nr:recombination regulator RecX [Spirochaetia bacterium]